MAEEKQKVTISMPLHITTGKVKIKKNYINLNQYRNWHYQVNNNIKIAYKEIAEVKLKELGIDSFKNRIRLTFTLWKRDKRRGDRANPLSIHEKFFCDALVECGAMPDDNDDFIESTHYYTGGIDKENPRVDVLIEEL